MKYFLTLSLVLLYQLSIAQNRQLRIPESFYSQGAKGSISNFFENINENIIAEKLKVYSDSNVTTELSLSAFDSIKKYRSLISTIYEDADSTYGTSIWHTTEFEPEFWEELSWNTNVITVKLSEFRTIHLKKGEVLKLVSHPTYSYLFNQLKTENQGSIRAGDLEKDFQRILKQNFEKLTQSAYKQLIPLYSSDLKAYSSLKEFSNFIKDSRCDTLDSSNDTIPNTNILSRGICVILKHQLNSEFGFIFKPIWVGNLFYPCISSVHLGLNPIYLLKFNDYLDYSTTIEKLVLSDIISLYLNNPEISENPY